VGSSMRLSPFDQENSSSSVQDATGMKSVHSVPLDIMNDPDFWGWCKRIAALAEEIGRRTVSERRDEIPEKGPETGSGSAYVTPEAHDTPV